MLRSVKDAAVAAIPIMAARPVCAVPCADSLDPDWRNAIEEAGFRIEDLSAVRAPSADLLVVFGGRTSDRLASPFLAQRIVPLIFVTVSGVIILTDSMARMHVLPYYPVDQVFALFRSLNPTLPDGTEMIGQSDACQDLRRRVMSVATSTANVLIAGESGTGKELVAAMIHEHSPRRKGPLVCVNCAAIPDALFESELFGHEKGAFTGAASRRDGAFLKGNSGTLFLDEIGDMSLYAQAKLLRVIESRRVARLGSGQELAVDVRIVAASNRDLETMMRKGLFRQDLFFRLAVVELTVPPLRNRSEDIALLIDHFSQVFSKRAGMVVSGASDSVLELLKKYAWPGNIRELRNLIEAALITSSGHQIEMGDLPESFCKRLCLPDTGERDRILTTLKSVNGNKSLAARCLHWSRVTLYRKLATHGIEYLPAASPSVKGGLSQQRGSPHFGGTKV